jgi:hypothetical protein
MHPTFKVSGCTRIFEEIVIYPIAYSIAVRIKNGDSQINRFIEHRGGCRNFGCGKPEFSICLDIYLKQA